MHAKEYYSGMSHHGILLKLNHHSSYWISQVLLNKLIGGKYFALRVLQTKMSASSGVFLQEITPVP